MLDDIHILMYPRLEVSMHPLTKWRTDNDLTQVQAAAKLQINQNDVSRYERFLFRPTDATVDKINKVVPKLGTAILVAYYDECRRIALEAQR